MIPGFCGLRQFFTKLSRAVNVRHRIRKQTVLFERGPGSGTDSADLHTILSKYIPKIHPHLPDQIKKYRHPDRACEDKPPLLFHLGEPRKRLPQRFIGRDHLCPDRRHLNDLCPQIPQSSCKNGHILAGSCKQELPSSKRPVFRPVQLFGKGTDFSCKDDGRRADPGPVRLFF